MASMSKDMVGGVRGKDEAKNVCVIEVIGLGCYDVFGVDRSFASRTRIFVKM